MAGKVYHNTLSKNAILDAFAAAYANGVARCYGGTIDYTTAAASLTHLVQFTKDGGAFTAGVSTNGLNLGTASAGALAKDSNDWEGTGLGSGTITWGRLYNNDLTKWISFSVNTSGAVMTVTTTAMETGTPCVVTSFTLSQPS